jgi:hypothetical protein
MRNREWEQRQLDQMTDAEYAHLRRPVRWPPVRNVGPMPCRRCHGTGTLPLTPRARGCAECDVECEACGGSGTVRCDTCHEHDATVTVGRMRLCVACADGAR